jgi:hypothetical protein
MFVSHHSSPDLCSAIRRPILERVADEERFKASVETSLILTTTYFLPINSTELPDGLGHRAITSWCPTGNHAIFIF